MPPSGAMRSASMSRAERTAPTMSGISELNTAMKRVMSASVTSSYTTSATSMPVLGRDCGVFSIYTDRAGQFRLCWLGSGSPVSGATTGLAEVVAVAFFLLSPPPPPHAATAVIITAAQKTTQRWRDIQTSGPKRPGGQVPGHEAGEPTRGRVGCRGTRGVRSRYLPQFKLNEPLGLQMTRPLDGKF